MAENQYSELLSSLQETLLGANSNKSLAADDNELNNAVVTQTREQDEEYDKRNRLYTNLLDSYISIYAKKEQAKSKYKAAFFIVIILLFVGIVVCGLIGLMFLSIEGDGNLANVGIAIANIAGIISSLVVLPKIIAEHLFPVDEESNMIGMVKNMQENDANIRNIIFNHDDNDN